MRKKIVLTVSLCFMMLAAFVLNYFWMPYYGSVEWTLGYGIARYTFYLIAPLPILFLFVMGFGGYMGDVWPLWGISLGLRAVCDAACMGLMAWLGDGLVCIPYFFDCLHVFACACAVQHILVQDKALLKETLKKRLPLLLAMLAAVLVFICFVQVWISGRIVNVFVAGSESYKAAFGNIRLMIYAGGFFVVLLSALMCLFAFAEVLPIVDTLGRLCFGWLMLLPMVYLLGLFVMGFVNRDYRVTFSLTGSYEQAMREELDFFSGDGDYRMKFIYADCFRHPDKKKTVEEHRTYQLMSPDGKALKAGLIVAEPEYQANKVDDALVGVYSPYHIVIYENDTGSWVEIDHLHRAEENPLLTAALKMLTEENDFLLFPHAAAYLIRYDPQFITPYLERYANADFTKEELERLGDIRPEYISTEARKLLDN